MRNQNWQKQLKDEFGIHFKDSSSELQFLEAFIEDLLEAQKQQIIDDMEYGCDKIVEREKENWQKELMEKIREIEREGLGIGLTEQGRQIIERFKNLLKEK